MRIAILLQFSCCRTLVRDSESLWQAVPVAAEFVAGGRLETFVPQALRNTQKGEERTDEAIIAAAALYEDGPTALIHTLAKRHGTGRLPVPPPSLLISCLATCRAHHCRDWAVDTTSPSAQSRGGC
jgi:hypothetical protein